MVQQSLKKLPLIGQQLIGGKHVLINRRSRKSQVSPWGTRPSGHLNMDMSMPMHITT